MNEISVATQAKRMTWRSQLLTAIAIIAMVGAVVSSISLYHHYGTSKTSFCDFGTTFNCDVVNRSAYSTVLGVPVALIGLCGYLFILALATAYRANRETPIILLVASIAGLGFSLYLTYIENFVLSAWCILCLTSLALILTETILGSVLAFTTRRAA